MRELLAANTVNDGKDIIAASPWITEEGSCPYRVVLRDTPSDFIVHTQQIDAEAGIVCFYWGDYFHKSGSNLDTLFAMAWVRFGLRSNKSLFLHSKAEECHVA